MLTENINVGKGQANGTEATIENITIKQGAKIHKIQLQPLNITVNAVYAHDVAHVKLRHKRRLSVDPIFVVKPKKIVFTANISLAEEFQTRISNSISMSMSAMQLPFIHNLATTVHKLQGSSRICMFINQFNYTAN